MWVAALATIGVAGGVYAAEQAATPGADGDELQRTITTQKINEGQVARRGPTSEHQREAFTPDQMLQLADQYGKEMKSAAEHVQDLRIDAYRSRDLIRMTCIDSKLTQLMTVVGLAEPRIADLPRLQGDGLVLQGRFVTIRLARERVTELAQEAEECMGDNLTVVGAGRIHDEVPPGSENVFDPTRPPAPAAEVARPPEASPYR